MNQHIEKEYKMLLTKEQYELLLQQIQPDPPVKQVNYYFDTDDHQIQKRKGALRIREREGVFLFTLKLHKEDDTLYEFEKLLPSCNQSALLDPEIQSLLQTQSISGSLQLIGELVTWRSIRITDDAEICLDKNIYRDVIDYEIEYEYIREHDGLSIFQSILDLVHLQYKENCRSKIARTLHLDHFKKES